MKPINAATLSLFGLALASVSSAASIIQTINFGPKTTDLTDADLGISKFDPALGTLQHVSISFNLYNDFSIGLENVSPSPVTLKYSLDEWGHAITLRDSSSNVLLTDRKTTSRPLKSVPVTAYDGKTDYSGSSGFTDPFSLLFSGETDPADIAPFIGSGSALFLTTNTEYAYTIFGSGFSASTRSVDSMAGKVTYDYDPVPEPATFITLASGALALARRRKKQ